MGEARAATALIFRCFDQLNEKAAIKQARHEALSKRNAWLGWQICLFIEKIDESIRLVKQGAHPRSPDIEKVPWRRCRIGLPEADRGTIVDDEYVIGIHPVLE